MGLVSASFLAGPHRKARFVSGEWNQTNFQKPFLSLMLVEEIPTGGGGGCGAMQCAAYFNTARGTLPDSITMPDYQQPTAALLDWKCGLRGGCCRT